MIADSTADMHHFREITGRCASIDAESVYSSLCGSSMAVVVACANVVKRARSFALSFF